MSQVIQMRMPRMMWCDLWIDSSISQSTATSVLAAFESIYFMTKKIVCLIYEKSLQISFLPQKPHWSQ